MTPIIIESDNIVMFDVDDTLVLWNIPQGMESCCIEFTNYGYTERLLPHLRHIECLKRFKFRGHKVGVWSQGGWEWALEVVKRLGIENDVDIIMTKPKWMVDDMPTSAWTTVFYKDFKEAEEITKKQLENMLDDE